MNTGDFYNLACFNYLSSLICLGPISRQNRHQRHQGLCWPSCFRNFALFCCWRQGSSVLGSFRFHL